MRHARIDRDHEVELLRDARRVGEVPHAEFIERRDVRALGDGVELLGAIAQLQGDPLDPGRREEGAQRGDGDSPEVVVEVDARAAAPAPVPAEACQ